MFMQLLMAQLKSQDPMDPVDPNQFVSQLVQFNSLNELQDMDGLLQQIASALNPQSSTAQPVSGGQ
jgi:flagellar basal-body rod modification protein FlgD